MREVSKFKHSKGIKDGINKLLTGPIGYGSEPLYLSELGVRTNQDGTSL